MGGICARRRNLEWEGGVEDLCRRSDFFFFFGGGMCAGLIWGKRGCELAMGMGGGAKIHARSRDFNRGWICPGRRGDLCSGGKHAN